MTAKVIALYNAPVDPAAFDAYYFGTHVPLALKLPGLKGYDASTGPVTALMDGAPQYQLGAVLTFDSLDAVGAALSSPEGQATAADLANFATGGVTLLVMQTRDVMA